MKTRFWILFLVGLLTCARAEAGWIYNPSATGGVNDATYITQTPNATLSAEQALNSLTADRLLRNTTGGVLASSLLSDDGTNVTLVSGQMLVPAGTDAAPGLADTTNTNSGLKFISGVLVFVRLGTAVFGISGGQVQMRGDRQFGWSSNANDVDAANTLDTLWGREAAAIIQQGVDSATPVAQTFKGPDGSGTNIPGANFTRAGGRGAGTGAGGSLIWATAPAGTTGSTQNPLVDRIQVESTGGLRWLTGTKPTCAAGIRGTVYYVAGAATVLDTFEVCRKDAADAYAWVTLF